MKSILTISCLSLYLTAVAAAQLIAEVKTSAGNFSINLNYLHAERTVANFMKLADGRQPWLDENTGRIQYNKPYYNGLTFHKTVNLAPPLSSSVRKYIQAGISGTRPGGGGGVLNDAQGAGYQIRDEMRTYFNGSLVIPHTKWAVTMANTGPHSASSQFIITLVDDSQFNYKNSAFGYVNQLYRTYNDNNIPVDVSNGWEVIQDIHASNLPVRIHDITFRRLDAAALAYDENAADASGELPLWGYPAITNVVKGPTDVSVTSSPVYASKVRLYASTDLLQWNRFSLFDVYTSSQQFSTPVISLPHGNSAKAFFYLLATSYPKTSAPADLLDKTIFVGKNTPESIRFIFDASNLNPIYHRISDGATGPLTYTYTQTGPFRGDLEINTPGLPHRTYRLFFGGTEIEMTTYQIMACQIVDLDLPGRPITESSFTFSSP